MAINVNELILDRVRSLIFTDLSDGSVLGRLTKLEDPSLQTTSEADEVWQRNIPLEQQLPKPSSLLMELKLLFPPM